MALKLKIDGKLIESNIFLLMVFNLKCSTKGSLEKLELCEERRPVKFGSESTD
jgi:hypothetical protein